MKKIFLVGSLIMSMQNAAAFQINSPDFTHQGTIAQQFTCGENGNKGGKNLIPRLTWSGVPKNTASFALIVDDPDAPGGAQNPWVHWLIYNIPADKTNLDYIKRDSEKMLDGTLQGMNSWPRLGYDGPCPPPGKPHRYFFKLYALDTMLALKPRATKQELQKAMQGHILASAEIIGLYGR
jgi:Raf kinase inhibitor-like YbhB/YbcL family protein